MMAIRSMALLVIFAGLSACGGDDTIIVTCDEKQRYQLVKPGMRVKAPEGLDSLNEYAEMPIPQSQDAPQRPPGAPCIELPPKVSTGS